MRLSCLLSPKQKQIELGSTGLLVFLRMLPGVFRESCITGSQYYFLCSERADVPNQEEKRAPPVNPKRSLGAEVTAFIAPRLVQ